MNAKRFIRSNAKKYVNSGNVKRIAVGAIEQQVKVLVAAVSTIVIHKMIQYLANKYPKLGFLRMAEDRAMRNPPV